MLSFACSFNQRREEKGKEEKIKMSLKQLATSLKLRKERSNDDLEEAASSDRRPSCQGLDTVEKDGIFEGDYFLHKHLFYFIVLEIELISFEINNKNRNSSQNLSLESRRKSFVL